MDKEKDPFLYSIMKICGRYRLFGLFIIILLTAVLAAHLLIPDKHFSGQEKRVLTEMPAFSWDSLKSGKLTSQAEEYAADQFPGRDAAMRLKMGISHALGQRISHGVYYMQDDSLAENFPEWDKDLAAKTESAIRSFAERHKDIPVYLLVTPTRIGLYEEYLPANAPHADQNAYIDGLYQALQDRVKTVDVRSALKAEKESGKSVYYLSDHHWTTDGAYAAYRVLADSLGIAPAEYRRVTVNNTFRGSLIAKSGFVLPAYDSVAIQKEREDLKYFINRTETNESFASCYFPEKLNGSDPYEVFFGGNYPLIRVETTAEEQKTLLIIKDSYANCMIPFLLESYEKIVIMDPRYYAYGADALFWTENISEVVFVYNAATLAADTSLWRVLDEK